MNLSELTTNLQSKIENEAAAKQNAAKERWNKVKKDHPKETKFIELINELIGKPKAIKIISGDNLIYGAGKFSPKRGMTVNLIGDYS